MGSVEFDGSVLFDGSMEFDGSVVAMLMREQDGVVVAMWMAWWSSGGMVVEWWVNGGLTKIKKVKEKRLSKDRSHLNHMYSR